MLTAAGSAVETRAAPIAVGRYRVVRCIGGGGQGLVYEAHDPQLGRPVAVKLLRRGKGDREARARLLREAAALARLSHPNVVAVNDVGVCSEGVFIVTQLVPGGTLAAWLRHRPAWPDVVAAFAAAGRGLEAAHRFGIVHRDFKPANVLRSDDGTIRLVDFGLAADAADTATRARTDRQRCLATGALTDTRCAVGTPAYMAPEQHEGGAVPPAADQYAFCVALYEGLWGIRPFGPANLRELLRAKLTRDLPPWPRRDPVPRRLRRIILTGLRPDPDERWPDMGTLVRALEQVLLARGRRRLFAGAAAVVVSGCVLAAWPSSPGPAACHSGAPWNAVWPPARRAALAAAFEATAQPFASDAASHVVASVDAFGSEWIAERARACDRLDAAPGADQQLACLDTRLADLAATLSVLEEPDDEVVRHAVAVVDAIEPPRRCRERSLPSPGASALAEVAEVRSSIGRVRALQIAGRFDEALVEVQRLGRGRPLPRYPPMQAELALAHALVLNSTTNLDAAHARAQDAYFTAASIGYDAIVFRAALLLARVEAGQGAPADAEAWLRRAEVSLSRLGPSADPVLRGQWMSTAAALAKERGDFPAALQAARECAEIFEAELGPSNQRTAGAATTVAGLLLALGRLDDAATQAQRATQATEAAVGPDHPQTARAMVITALVLKQRGEFAAALEVQRRVLAIQEAALGAEAPAVAGTLMNMGVLHSEMGRPRAAEHAYDRALRIQRRSLGPDHPHCARTLHNLAITLRDLGDTAGAAQAYGEAVRIGEAALGDKHPVVTASLGGLASVYAMTGRPTLALTILERVAATQRETLGDEHPRIGDTLARIAETHRVAGHLQRARQSIEQAIEITTTAYGADHPDVGRMRYERARCMAAAGNLAEAVAEITDALDTVTRTLGREHATVAVMTRSLSSWQRELGRRKPNPGFAERARD